MSEFIFPPPITPSLSIEGTEARFPVRRVWCVGRNYAAHARELGNDEREPPFFFSKQPDMLVPGGGRIPYPGLTQNYHYETELVVALKAGGTNITVEDAPSLIFGYAVGFDMTRRDLQRQMGDKGKPWEIGKSFDHSAPIGTLVRAEGRLWQGQLTLRVNGAVKQDAPLDQMIWNVPEIIARLSTQVGLAAGDVIFTGTPEGVGAVQRGDCLVAEITGLPKLAVEIV
jgi:fumarylpyruvate hydrolase